MPTREMCLDAGNTGSTSFPSYVLEQQRRLTETEAEMQRDHVRAMSAAVGRIPQHCASLRQSADIIEASVLALGVSTTHGLISALNEVRSGLEEARKCWASLQSRQQELSRQREETMGAMSDSYISLLDKSLRAERELKQMVAERDRKDAALDQAVEYVHCVVAERAAWQEKNGFNAAELPVEEQRFSAQCSTALSSLHASRDALKTTTMSSTGSTAARLSNGANANAPSSMSSGDGMANLPGLSASARLAASARGLGGVSNAQNTYLSAASASARRPMVSTVDDQTTLSARWRSIEDARHTTFVPSARLRYIPPQEEVEMLRQVLAMGLGNSVLMRDLETQRRQFAAQKRHAEAQWRDGLKSLQTLKREIAALKAHMQNLVEQGIPFIYYRQELVRLLNAQVEREVQRRMRYGQSRSSQQSLATRRDTAVDGSPRHFSTFSPSERASLDGAEGDDDVVAFSTKLPHFIHRMYSTGEAGEPRPYVFPPPEQDRPAAAATGQRDTAEAPSTPVGSTSGTGAHSRR